MCSELVDVIEQLGEIVYLDFPFEDVAHRIDSRPSGYSDIVGFTPESPSLFLSSREEFYETCCTHRIKFPKNQTLSDSVETVKEKLFNEELNLFVTTRSENVSVDFPTVALSGLGFNLYHILVAGSKTGSK